MGWLDRITHRVNDYDEEYDAQMGEENEGYPEEEDDGYDEDSRFGSFASSSGGAAPRSGRVVSMRAAAQLQVMLFQPVSFDEVKEIATQLNKKVTVVLNLEKCADEPARRILDFLSGAAFANSGTVKPIANKTFLLTPSNVDLMGDLLSELADNGFTLH